MQILVLLFVNRIFYYVLTLALNCVNTTILKIRLLRIFSSKVQMLQTSGLEAETHNANKQLNKQARNFICWNKYIELLYYIFWWIVVFVHLPTVV